jgi:hypothetical protein
MFLCCRLNHTDLSNPLGRLTQVKGQGDDHQIKGVIHSLGRCLQRVVTDDGTDYNRRTLRKSVDNMLEELGHLSMRDEVIKKSKELRYCKSCPKRTLKREDKNGLVIQVVWQK